MTKDRAFELANECIDGMIKRHMPSPVSHIADAILAAVEEETSRPAEFVYSEETKAKAREMFEDIQVAFKSATGRPYKRGQSDAEDRLYADMFIPLRAMLRRARRRDGPLCRCGCRESEYAGSEGIPYCKTCPFCAGLCPC